MSIIQSTFAAASTRLVAAPSSLDAVFAPRSVALVGASTDERRFGGRPLQYLKRSGFSGPIYPVNPSRAEVQGLPAFASLDDIPGPIDCAILALGPDDTIDAVETCARLGVKSAILYAAGFSELGEEGRLRQDAMVATARAAGLRLLGPNCMGVLNVSTGFYGTFASALEEGLPEGGPIGLVSQSGGYGGYVMKHVFNRGLGLAAWATTGNECDIEFGEVMEWMAARDDVEVLVGYLEGVRSKDSLVRALTLARANHKPVVMMKVGRTAEGSAAAASHTAALTGEDAIYDAVFREFGVHRAKTTEELLDVAQAATKRRLPRGRRVGVISISGGIGVQIADYVSDQKLELSVVPAETQAALRELVPACSPRNPIDMTGLVTTNHDLMRQTVDLTLASNAFDAVVIFIGIAGSAPSMAEPLRQAIETACTQHPDALMLISITGSPEMVQAYDRAGMLVFEDPSRAVAALSALCAFAEAFAAAPKEPPASPPLFWPEIPTGTLNEVQAKALVAKCGVRTPIERLVTSPAEAHDVAAEIGGAVAVKVVSADIAHKTEYGGVALNLETPEAAASAVQGMMDVIPQRLPQARIDGYLVSEMVTGGVECIIGAHRDPVMGPVVTFGLGGVLVELLKDTVCRLAPVTQAEAREMITELKTYPLLASYRGGPAHDIEALAVAIAAVSRLAAENPDRIDSVEINPAVAMPAGGGVVALDAVIQIRNTEVSIA